MKKVKNKIIALMMVIPLLLMFSLSTAAKTVEVLVDVPVSNVTLTANGEKDLETDILSDSKVKLQTKIEPSTATHKQITYTTQAVEGKKQADVEITEDGLVVPKSTGTVVILATVGGKQDSVTLTFNCDYVTEVLQSTTSMTLKVGDSRKIVVSSDISVYPSNAQYDITFAPSNESVISVNAQGVINAKFAGVSLITVSISGVEYNSSSKGFVNTVYQKDIKVTVEPVQTDNVISFVGGESSLVMPSFAEPQSNIEIFVSDKINYNDLSFAFDNSAINSVIINSTNNNGLYLLTVNWKDNTPKGDYNVDIVAYGNTVGTVTLQRGVVQWSINFDEHCFLAVERYKDIDVSVNGLKVIEEYRINYISSDPKVLTVSKKDENTVRIQGRAEGTAVVTARLIIGDDEVYGEKSITVNVVKPYNSISIKNDSTISAMTTSLAKELVLGGFEYQNGELCAYKFSIPVNVSYKTGVFESSVVGEKLNWTTDNDRIAVVDNGVITVTGVDSGFVTLTVSSAYNQLLGYDVSATFKVRVVADAVNVKTYDDLMLAQNQQKQVVLQSDIMIAPLLKENYNDEKWRSGGYKDYIEGRGEYQQPIYKTMDPTCDISYYKALGKTKDAKLKYLVEFTNNLYGNGYSINADYVTKGGEMMYAGANSKGFLFNGPLSLVKISYATDSSATDNASIKSQDNIVFLVKNDNISITNVELKGCSDSSVGNNLSNLDYVGTVLEVVGNNFDLSYSKVNNGRTVVRIYGSANADEQLVKSNIDDYKITANIQNCILSYGREFILKMGTNQLKRGENIATSTNLAETNWYPGRNSDYKQYYDQANPYLTKQDGSLYTTTEQKDDYFVNNYVLTDVTLKDCVFVSAGLLCVGMDSQFGGLALDGWNYSDNYRFGTDKGWGDVAGTSYPARLRLEGDVRFYDWKKISGINSDTLLEAGSTIIEKLHLNLNIADLIESFRTSGTNDELVNKFVLMSGGDSYINGAIAMYGGGKNYSIVQIDAESLSEDFTPMYPIEIDVKYFSVNHPQIIYFAAGIEPFRFMVYQANSTNPNHISYERQQKDLSDNSAYMWIYKK